MGSNAPFVISYKGCGEKASKWRNCTPLVPDPTGVYGPLELEYFSSKVWKAAKKNDCSLGEVVI